MSTRADIRCSASILYAHAILSLTHVTLVEYVEPRPIPRQLNRLARGRVRRWRHVCEPEGVWSFWPLPSLQSSARVKCSRRCAATECGRARPSNATTGTRRRAMDAPQRASSNSLLRVSLCPRLSTRRLLLRTPFFQTVRSRAEHLGYNSALASPVRCLSDDGVTPIYAAVLFDGVDPSRYAIIRSRVDTKEPFLTVLYRDGGDHGSDIVLSNGGFRRDVTPNGSDIVTYLDANEQPFIDLGGPRSVPSTCLQRATDYSNCMNENLLPVFAEALGCVLEVGLCLRAALLLPPPYWGLGLVCILSGEISQAHPCRRFDEDPTWAQCIGLSPKDRPCVAITCQGANCACANGICHIDNFQPSGWSCDMTQPMTSPCDPVCETCKATGCESTCGGCTKCQNGTCNSTVPQGLIKWAKITQATTVGPSCSNPCAFGPSCACTGCAAVAAEYYNCKNPPLRPQLLGRCGKSNCDGFSGFPTCGFIPPQCDPVVIRDYTTWPAFNTCANVSCSGSAHGCQNPAAGNLITGAGASVGLPKDLRTDEEIRAGCCRAMP